MRVIRIENVKIEISYHDEIDTIFYYVYVSNKCVTYSSIRTNYLNNFDTVEAIYHHIAPHIIKYLKMRLHSGTHN